MPTYPARWSYNATFMTVDTSHGLTTLRSIAERVRTEQPSWVVLKRGELSYAFRPNEILELAQQRRLRMLLPSMLGLGLWRNQASLSVSAYARPGELPYVPGPGLESAGRAVAYDAAGEPVSVGEPALEHETESDRDFLLGEDPEEPFDLEPPYGDELGEEPAEGPAGEAEPPFELGTPSGGYELGEEPAEAPPDQAPEAPEPHLDLGPPRGGYEPRESAEEAPVEPSAPVDAVLSAQAPAQIEVGTESPVDIQVELKGGATPLARSFSAQINEREQIAAILTGFDFRKIRVENRVLRLDPPKAGRPSVNAFAVRGLQPGPSDLTVSFQQGGSELGQISFRIDVVPTRTSATTLTGEARAEARDSDDDRVVALLIDEELVGDQIRYRCLVTSSLLELDNAEYTSKPVEARAGSAASASLGYVQSIYRRITERVLTNQDDLKLFERELKAIGADLCSQLFDPQLTRLLWDVRDEIELVKITSLEPYIPWELLRLKHPGSAATDDRFLSEYGLVRSLSGRSFPKKLRGNDWRYLVGSYPLGSLQAVGGEADFIIHTLPARHRLTPQPIPAQALAVLDALARPDFDVLHIACHGSADLEDIDRTEIVIGDRELPGRKVGLISLDAVTVREEAKLRERAPLVFLNACESGQQAPSLTDWGGWPKTFWGAGAGAFIGTSWSVRENPAAAFAETFYDSFLAGSTLAAATTSARTKAKTFRDASWLAFVAYGQPNARLTRG